MTNNGNMEKSRSNRLIYLTLYITFKSAVKHRQLGYGYPRGQIVHLAEATTQDTYSSI